MRDKPAPLLIAVMGPTGSGKTPLAEALADRLEAKLVNADAFQIYRGMDIGTAKPERKERYALLDIRNPNESFGVGEWVQEALPHIREAWESQASVIVVGGTGFYVRALFESYSDLRPPPDPELRKTLDRQIAENGLASVFTQLEAADPEAARSIDPQNPARVRRALERALSRAPASPVNLPQFRQIKLGLELDSESLTTRIEARVGQMLHNGWIQEVSHLRKLGYGPDDPGFRALGYRQIWQHTEGKLSLEEATTATIVAIRQYAKRQRTWLRSEPRLTPIPALPASEALSRAILAVEAIV